jgi:hypothetical protein
MPKGNAEVGLIMRVVLEWVKILYFLNTKRLAGKEKTHPNPKAYGLQNGKNF